MKKLKIALLSILSAGALQGQMHNMYNLAPNPTSYANNHAEVIDVDNSDRIVWGTPMVNSGTNEYAIQVIKNSGGAFTAPVIHKLYSGMGIDIKFHGLIAMHDNTIVTGVATDGLGKKSIYVSSIDNNDGIIVWSKRINFDDGDHDLTRPILRKVNDQDFVVVCEYFSTTRPGHKGIYAFKMDFSMGGSQWGSEHHTYALPANDPEVQESLRLEDIYSDNDNGVLWVSGEINKPITNIAFLYKIDLSTGLGMSDFHFYDLNYRIERTRLTKDNDHVYLTTHAWTAGVSLLKLNDNLIVQQALGYLPPFGYSEMYFNEIEYNKQTGMIDVLPQFYGPQTTGFGQINSANLTSINLWEFDYVGSNSDETAIDMVYANLGQPNYDHYFLTKPEVPTTNTVQILYNDPGNCLPTTAKISSGRSQPVTNSSSEAYSRPVCYEEEITMNVSNITMDVHNCARTYTTNHKRNADEVEVEERLQNSITIAPNPTSSLLKLQFPEETSGELTLMDMFGKLIARKTISNVISDELNMEALPAGIYMLNVNVNGKKETHRVVKSN